jgi:hypothetical protein
MVLLVIGNVQNFAIVRKASSTHCFFCGEFSPLFRKRAQQHQQRMFFKNILHNLSNFKKQLPYFYNRLQHATRGIKGFLKITLLNFLSSNQI